MERPQWGSAAKLAQTRYETARAIYHNLLDRHPIATRASEVQEIVNGADDEMRAARREMDAVRRDDPNWGKLIWNS